MLVKCLNCDGKGNIIIKKNYICKICKGHNNNIINKLMCYECTNGVISKDEYLKCINCQGNGVKSLHHQTLHYNFP
jgi:RecJ-like exonuclease